MKILVLPTVVYVSNDSCKSYTLVFGKQTSQFPGSLQPGKATNLTTRGLKENNTRNTSEDHWLRNSSITLKML